MRLRLGGKTDPSSGTPLDVSAEIRAIRPNMFQWMGQTQMPMGTGVWLEVAGNHIVVSDKRTQAFHPICFTSLGIDLSAVEAIVVKSSQHFYAGFSPIAAEVIYVNGPGAISPDYGNIAYQKRSPNYWPKVEEPHV